MIGGRRRLLIGIGCVAAFLGVAAYETRPAPGRLRAASTDPTCALPEALRRDQPVSFLSAVSGAAGRALGSDLRATGVVAQVSGTRRVTGDGLQPPAALDLGDPRNAAADASGVRTNVTIAVVIDRIAIGTSGRCRTLVLLGARTDGGEPGHPGSYWPSLEVPEPGDRIVLLGSRRAGADIIVDSIVVTAPDGTFAIEGATYRTDDWHPLG